MMGSRGSSYPQVEPRAEGSITAPVKEIPADLSLAEARAFMVAERVGYLVARLGRRVGLVGRRSVEQAGAWDIGKQSVALILWLDIPVGGAGESLGRLPIRVQRLLAIAGRVGDEQGVAVALVGGAVRALLLGARELDVDLVVEGDGLAFARRFARWLGARVTPHPPLLTARLTPAEGRAGGGG